MAFRSPTNAHRWRFQRLGGFDQVSIESSEDLCRLTDLDQKLWSTLSCPTTGVEFDLHTLALLDVDHDGRIRAPEILAAVEWVCSTLKDPGDLLKGEAGLPLEAINEETDAGQRVLKSARQILNYLGRSGAAVITAEDTADTHKIFSETRFNGDGVVPPAVADDPFLEKAMEDIMVCVGSSPDRSGAQGIDEAFCDTFFAEAKAHLDWWAEAEADSANILPLGEATQTAAQALEAVRTKIDDFFTRARLAGYDERAAAPLNPAEGDYGQFALQEISVATPEVAAFPLARIEADRALPLCLGVNPAWSAALQVFRIHVLVPLLGEGDALTEDQWIDIKRRFATHAAWQARRRGEAVSPLGIARVKTLATEDIKQRITALIARDRELEGTANAIESVDRLVHYYQHLSVLLNNFVSLDDFYTPGKQAMFQVGTLYLDGRSCDLCVRVDDIDAHSALAGWSRTYLAYCRCQRRGGEDTMTIAAAFTAGDADNLMEGRNGLFYDRKGDDWDATIVRIIDNPISVSQAFWGPYKRVARLISQQIEKFSGAREKAIEEGVVGSTVQVAATAQEGKAVVAPFDIGKFAGIFAAIGLAVGAIGTALASVLTGFMGLSWWQVPIAMGGLILVISGPSMIIAWLKLRQRNLGPILDANGWAVNALAKINIPFGATLTSTAALPRGSERSLRDPFAEKRRAWQFYLFLLVLLTALGALWQKGYLVQWWESMSVPLEPGPNTDASVPSTPVSPTSSPE